MLMLVSESLTRRLPAIDRFDGYDEYDGVFDEPVRGAALNPHHTQQFHSQLLAASVSSIPG